MLTTNSIETPDGTRIFDVDPGSYFRLGLGKNKYERFLKFFSCPEMTSYFKENKKIALRCKDTSLVKTVSQIKK